jgi:NAD(P)-dependent dehydrogenase (short-subunit alcohol dehydrogenase family)
MKTAFVTGAARGLGKEIATALARDGHALFLVDILADELEQTAGELRAAGHQVETRAIDVTSRADCFAAVEDCVQRTGNLTVLVNVAGILRMERFTDMPEDGWNRIVAVNLSGPVFICQAAIPHVIAAKGNIVNVTSATGLFGAAYASAYAATKAALNSITKTLAMEYMDEPIRVNAVCPGGMATPMTVAPQPPRDPDYEKLKRYAGMRGQSQPAEVAAVVAFLASDAASAVHGALWAADAGMSAG